MSNPSKTLSNQIEQYPAIKNSLTDFVLDADGKIATALESYSARQLSRWAKPPLSGLNRSELAIDMFLSEGQVGQTTVLQLFIEEQPDLSTEIGHWITQWSRAFQGLFVVQEIPESSARKATQPYTLTNWLTNKSYSVWCSSSQQPDTINRIQPGEIVLARLLPLAPAPSTTAWTFSGPMTLLGKLGKPKLAVAIGNFKQWFPEQLYGDAPELKAAAWESVQHHYDDFVAFFGSEKITLSGYELSKKLQAYQEQVSEKQLAAAGLDSHQSLQEMAQDAGLSEEEVSEAVASLGDEGRVVKKLLESQRSLKMVMPKVTLPDELRNAKAVTVLVHPKWGQAFFKDYQTLENRLVEAEHPDQAQQTDEAASETSREALDKLVLKYLQDKQATTYVWQQLAQAHSSALEAALRRVLDNPNFIITKDLDNLMTQYDKPLTPDLPETASVPIHLHDLFQEALKSVSKGSGTKSRSKKAKHKKKAGFGS